SGPARYPQAERGLWRFPPHGDVGNAKPRRCESMSPASGEEEEGTMSTTTRVAEEKLPFFMKKNRAFGTIDVDKDDLLHPQSFVGVDDDSATETQYFGFSVPEAGIHALTYMWWHPN